MAITSLKCTGSSFDVVTLPKQVFFHNSFKLGFSAKFIPSLTDWVVSFHQFSINQEDKLLSFTYKLFPKNSEIVEPISRRVDLKLYSGDRYHFTGKITQSHFYLDRSFALAISITALKLETLHISV